MGEFPESRPLSLDGAAESAASELPGFLARPPGAPVYDGFVVLSDACVDGFTLGMITDFDASPLEGDAFIIAPDRSRAGLVWRVSHEPLCQEVCSFSTDRWGVWTVNLPLPMSGLPNQLANLRAILPDLKVQWAEWRLRMASASVGRSLRIEEQLLIAYLLSRTASAGLSNSLAEARVKDLNDGGMGSIRFLSTEPAKLGHTLVEAGYQDSDGVLASIALCANNAGGLFELDIWKVDFTPLVTYPKPADLLPGR